jgi:hypothetical protein
MLDKKTEKRITVMLPILNEKQRRLYLAEEAEGLGFGGVKAISELTGMSPTTIIAGKKENLRGGSVDNTRIRRIGGGRKTIKTTQKGIEEAIEALVSDQTFGNPENPLTYTTKSLRKLEEELTKQGFKVSHDTIGNILKSLDYSLQQNQKMLQIGGPHPDRNEQFEYINRKAKSFIKKGEPVISVDTKKKELIGNFKNNGVEYNKTKTPVKVLDHDFPLKELGKVSPYGIYDINANVGFVNLGTSKDTAEFAVESIMRWWNTLGKNTYPKASKIYINCDSGGSNGSKVKRWKKQLQAFADLTGLKVHVSHFPPGTSKWNKIEHKMFCFISKNRWGKPLISVKATIDLIGNTTTATGLKIICVADKNKYEIGKTVTDEELACVTIKKDKFHGDWNYVIARK